MRIPVLLKRAMGIFRSFVKIYGASARPKHRHRNWYRILSHRNITLFRLSWENGTHKYASLRSSLHMYSFFCKRVFSDCKLSILKCRKGMHWINSFKLITGLLLPSFFFTKNILFRNWCFCDKLVPQYPSSRDFPLLMSSLESLFPFCSLSCFSLQRNGIRYPFTISKIFWSFVSFHQLPMKCSNFPASATVRIFKLQNDFLPIDVLMTTLPPVSVVEFFWGRLLFLLPEFLNFTLL